MQHPDSMATTCIVAGRHHLEWNRVHPRPGEVLCPGTHSHVRRSPRVGLHPGRGFRLHALHALPIHSGGAERGPVLVCLLPLHDCERGLLGDPQSQHPRLHAVSRRSRGLAKRATHPWALICARAACPKPACPKVACSKMACPKPACPKVACSKMACPKLACPKVACSKMACPKVACSKMACPKVACSKVACPKMAISKDGPSEDGLSEHVFRSPMHGSRRSCVQIGSARQLLIEGDVEISGLSKRMARDAITRS
jgi:hypothetical protein